MGVAELQGKERFGGQTPSQNMPLQIAAKPSVLCCHHVNTNEELDKLATAIPPFTKLLWSLFCIKFTKLITHKKYFLICMHTATVSMEKLTLFLTHNLLKL